MKIGEDIMNAKILEKFSLLIVFFLVLSVNLLAQQPKKALLDDIEIMEMVLDKIITPQNRNINILGSNSKGFYLKDYGIIFNVNYSPKTGRIISFTNDRKINSKENDILIVKKSTGEEKNTTQDEMKQIKSSITRFFCDWAPALKKLPPNEKIAIIVDFNGFFPGLYYSQFQETDAPYQQLIASVSMKDILDYKREKISDEEFNNIITFDEIKSIDEDISILSNVIQTSLEHRNKNINLSTSGDVKGIYFQGYGAIFITNLSPAAQSVQMYLRSFYKDGARSVTFENNVNKANLGEENLHKVEDKMIRIISNYGHTLRTLKQDEWLEIALNLRGTFFNENYTKSILKIQKKTLDDFSKEKINYDQLKKQVKIIRY